MVGPTTALKQAVRANMKSILLSLPTGAVQQQSVPPPPPPFCPSCAYVPHHITLYHHGTTIHSTELPNYWITPVSISFE